MTARTRHRARPPPEQGSNSWRRSIPSPGAWASPAESKAGEWLPASVPGTAAAALAACGRWSLEDPEPLHEKDIWYRVHLPGPIRGMLRFGGLATIAEVWLDGRLLFASDNMFEAHEAAVV